ncbi:MAG TPA: dephospho-CoA kinase [Candidatus Nanopelagicales bacterium]|nr:dephospho-CoA kinase [Candidatus Nanopelagicales bacterium]
MSRAGGAAAGRALRIGLTGPIGCGKSTVAGWLAFRGAVVVDADAVARAATAPGEPAHEAVLARFGDAVRGPDGALDRAALARLVFADAAALRDLEAIVHPAVRPRILAAFEAADRAGAPAVVIEAIKLVEGGLAALCDEVWLVTCGPEAQRARLAGRGMPPADAERRIAAQAGLVARARALPRVVVVDASGDRGETEEMVAAAYAAALARTGAGPDRSR